MRKKIKKLMEGAISPDGQNDRLLQEVVSKRILDLRSNEHAMQSRENVVDRQRENLGIRVTLRV